MKCKQYKKSWTHSDGDTTINCDGEWHDIKDTVDDIEYRQRCPQALWDKLINQIEYRSVEHVTREGEFMTLDNFDKSRVLASILSDGKWNFFNIKDTIETLMSYSRKGLFITGESGDGKTHYMTGLIQALFNRSIERKEKPPRFKLLDAGGSDGLQGIFTSDAVGEKWADDEIARALMSDVLFIDDLGEEKIPAGSQVFESGLSFILKKYTGRLLITSNLKIGDPSVDPVEGELRYDRRIRRRLEEKCIQMSFSNRR